MEIVDKPALIIVYFVVLLFICIIPNLISIELLSEEKFCMESLDSYSRRQNVNRVYCKVDGEYVLRAGGELQYSGGFWVDKSTIKNWEPPHENEPVTLEQYEDLVNRVNSKNPENSVPIKFI